MTVTITTRPFVSYTGDGTRTNFSIPFSYRVNVKQSNITVKVNNILQTYTTHYTIDDTSREVQFVSAPGNDLSVTIERITPLTQQADFTNYKAFDANEVQDSLDKITEILQEIIFTPESGSIVNPNPNTTSTTPLNSIAIDGSELILPYITGGSVSGNTLTLTRNGLSNLTISNLPSLTGASLSSGTLTITRVGGNDITVPGFNEGTGSIVTGGSVSGDTLTITQSEGGDVTISGFNQGSTVTGGSVSGDTLTLTQSEGGSVTISGLPTLTGGTLNGDTLTLTQSGGSDIVITGFSTGGPTINITNELNTFFNAASHRGVAFDDRFVTYRPSAGTTEYTDIENVRGYTTRLWARPTNTDLIPTEKLATGTADRTVILAGSQEWVTLPHFDQAIPLVNKLPDAVDPDFPIVFLTHEYTEGTQSDAIMTVGFSGIFAGYNRAGLSLFGTINKSSPVTKILGQGNSGNYRLDDAVFSYSRDFINSINRITINNNDYELGTLIESGGEYFKRILNGPSGLSTTTLMINFRRTDGTYYFTDGSGTTHRAGLYQDTLGEWHALVSNRQVHNVGTGPPEGVPNDRGIIYINNDGKMWTSAGETRTINTPASATDTAFTNPWYVREPASLTELWDTVTAATNSIDPDIDGRGGFYWPDEIGSFDFTQFLQNQGTRRTSQQWTAVWEYIEGILDSENVAANAPIRDTITRLKSSLFIGGFSGLQDAADDLSLRISQADFDGGTRDYYWGYVHPNNLGVRRFVTWTKANFDTQTTFHWEGPLVSEQDINDRLAPDASNLSDGQIIQVSEGEWIARTTHPIVVLTQAQYDALSPPVSGTLYFITDA